MPTQFSKKKLHREYPYSPHLEQEEFDSNCNFKSFIENKQNEMQIINNQKSNEITDNSSPHFRLTLVSIIANINDLVMFEAIISGNILFFSSIFLNFRRTYAKN